MYTFVTSLNQEYWKSTSKTNLLSWDKYLSDSCEIVIYTEDNTFREALGADNILDNAIHYYLDEDAEEVYDNEDGFDWDE